MVAALGQPVAGVVFVLDGVLIGAGDGRYLAWAGLAVLVVYTPAVFAAAFLTGGLVAVWAPSPGCSWARGSWCSATGPGATRGW